MSEAMTYVTPSPGFAAATDARELVVTPAEYLLAQILTHQIPKYGRWEPLTSRAVNAALFGANLEHVARAMLRYQFELRAARAQLARNPQWKSPEATAVVRDMDSHVRGLENVFKGIKMRSGADTAQARR